jgi:predicted dehydrogenase
VLSQSANGFGLIIEKAGYVMIRLGVIGMGRRAAHLTATLQRIDAQVQLAAIADPRPETARLRLAEAKVDDSGTTIVSSADALLERAEQFDALMIGSNCDSHSPIAIKCAPLELPLFMEKPVAITHRQLEELAAAFAGRDDNVVVSFPLRMTPLFQRVEEIVKSGRLGVINQVQAFNYVPYGGVYFGQWYRDFDVTGGLWLQKATHDFDYITQLVQSIPQSIAAIGSHRIYGGEMPPGLRCSACDYTETCPESPRSIADRGNDGGMGFDDHDCAFSSSIRHHDAGSAIIRYRNGVHAAYSQNFVSRQGAAWRGARVTGYRATLQFDWYNESVTVIDHHTSAVDEIKFSVVEGHNGGDVVLAQNFINVIRGDQASQSTLADGILSATMCVAAERSEKNGTFEAVESPMPILGKSDSKESGDFCPTSNGAPLWLDAANGNDKKWYAHAGSGDSAPSDMGTR